MEILPRRRIRVKGATNQEALDAELDRASSPALRGRGRGQSKGRDRGRMTKRAEEAAAGGAILEVVVEIRRVHQAIENLARMIAYPRWVEG